MEDGYKVLFEQIDKEDDGEKELQEYLTKVSNKLVTMGVTEYIIVIAKDGLVNGGMSKTQTVDGTNTPIKLLRETLKEWEYKQGQDPNHDWS